MSGTTGRAAGLLVPLFALRDRGDWGIGEIGHLERFTTWLAGAGHRLLQLLPINEMPPGERSPYAAVSAFAIDPIYVTLAQVEDFVASGGEASVAADVMERIASLRAGRGVDYDGVRAVKHCALAQAFAHFRRTEWASGSARAAAFQQFREAEAGWLADYALFRVWQEQGGWRAWMEWDGDRRTRTPAVLAAGRRAAGEDTLLHEYVQWQGALQWERARQAALAAGVRLVGDVPFGVARNSVDVWAHQDEFVCDASLGAPPDAFNADGQEWGLPPYRWDVVAGRDFAWLRQRVAYAATRFDAIRIDHVVGFYRMYVLPAAGQAGFVPADETEQLALGERLLSVVRAAAGTAGVLGEDLGVVPDFVRGSLARLQIPGYRVLRWEADGGVFRDPAGFPRASVATTGTHDTSSLATWWCEELDDAGRAAVAAVPSFAQLASAGATWTPAVGDVLLDGVYGAGSDLVLVPVQDLYGGRERINTPATVGPGNWDYRLPWMLDELSGERGRALAAGLRALCVRHRR